MTRSVDDPRGVGPAKLGLLGTDADIAVKDAAEQAALDAADAADRKWAGSRRRPRSAITAAGTDKPVR